MVLTDIITHPYTQGNIEILQQVASGNVYEV